MEAHQISTKLDYGNLTFLHPRCDLPIRPDTAVLRMKLGYANFANFATKLVAIASYIERSEKRSDRSSALTSPESLLRLVRYGTS